MRAKTINEFHRGGDPLVKMDIGNKAETLHAINNWLESLKTYKEHHEKHLEQNVAIYKLQKEYKNLNTKHDLQFRLAIYKIKKQIKKFDKSIERVKKLKAKYES